MSEQDQKKETKYYQKCIDYISSAQMTLQEQISENYLNTAKVFMELEPELDEKAKEVFKKKLDNTYYQLMAEAAKGTAPKQQSDDPISAIIKNKQKNFGKKTKKYFIIGALMTACAFGGFYAKGYLQNAFSGRPDLVFHQTCEKTGASDYPCGHNNRQVNLYKNEQANKYDSCIEINKEKMRFESTKTLTFESGLEKATQTIIEFLNRKGIDADEAISEMRIEITK